MHAPDTAIDFLKIAFGWVLGLLSSNIVEWQKHRRRQKKLTASINAEMRELKHRMAWVAMTIRMNRGTVDANFLDWLEPIIRNYEGPERTAELDELVSNLQAVRAALLEHPNVAQPRRENIGVALKEFTAPLLAAHMSEISESPVAFQSATLKVKAHLDLFNQAVAYMDKQERRTFDLSIIGNNREAVMANIEQGYTDLEKRARAIADAISQIPK